jgi:hypothetical protein
MHPDVPYLQMFEIGARVCVYISQRIRTELSEDDQSSLKGVQPHDDEACQPLAQRAR